MALYENAIDYSAPGLNGATEEPFIGGGGPMAMLQNDPEFAARLRQMPPEERQQFMRQVFQDYAGKESIIADDQLAAEELIGTRGPEGVYTRRGGYVAGNPLGHLASAVKQGKGYYDQKQAREAKEALSADRTGGVGSIADLISQQMMDAEMRNNRRGEVNPFSLGDELQQSPYRMA